MDTQSQPLKTASTSREPLTPVTRGNFKIKFNRALTEIMAGRTDLASALDSAYGELLEQMSAFIGRGGKRLRPYLTYLSYVGLGGTDEAAIVKIAASQELYHNAWLIHDDIIDQDTIRYGGLNLTGLYVEKLKARGVAKPRQLAEAMALIAGDINMSIAIDLILASPFPAERKIAAARLSQRLNFELAGGEMLDVLMPTLPADEVSSDRLLKVCRFKTATYSFESPLQIGAILAGADQKTLKSLTSFAVPLGIAFQLVDDLLGTFGDEQTLGKPVSSDLREGKLTLLMQAGLDRAGRADRAYLQRWRGDRKAGIRQLERVRRIFTSTGAKAAIENLADSKVAQALRALPSIGYSESVQSQLQELARYTLARRV